MNKLKSWTVVTLTSFLPIILFVIVQVLALTGPFLEKTFGWQLYGYHYMFFFGYDLALFEYFAVFNIIAYFFCYNLFLRDKQNKSAAVVKYVLYAFAIVTGVFFFALSKGTMFNSMISDLTLGTLFYSPIILLVILGVIIIYAIVSKIKGSEKQYDYSTALAKTIDVVSKFFLAFSLMSCMLVIFPMLTKEYIIDEQMKAVLYMFTSMVILDFASSNKSKQMKIFLAVSVAIIIFYIATFYMYEVYWHYVDFNKTVEFTIPFTCSILYLVQLKISKISRKQIEVSHS